MSVQRYNRAGDDVIGMFPGMMKHPKGRWVLFDSHQSSIAEREQRTTRLCELVTDWIRDATHKRNCDHWYTVPGCVPSCSCGLSSLRAALAATEGEKQ